MTVDDQLDARFRTAALRERLVDVRFDVIDSPVGELAIAATDRGLCRISYGVDGFDEEVSRAFGVRVLRSPLDDVRRELDEYFEGVRRDFDLPLDLRVAPFHEEVLEALARVPYGLTTTYGTLAREVGPKPDSDRASVPPGDRCQRLAHGLRRRARYQAPAASSRRRDATPVIPAMLAAWQAERSRSSSSAAGSAACSR